MNQIARQVIPVDGEIITGADTVRVVGYLDPMKQRLVDLALPAGLTLAELLELATRGQRRLKIEHALIAQVDGLPVPPEWWSRVRPRAGRTVSFFCRITGDQSRTLMGLAVIVASLFIAPMLAPYAVSGFAAAGITVGAQTAGGIIGAVLATGGMLALGSLYPVQTPQLRETPQFKSRAGIQGGSNGLPQYGAVPSILGQHRFYPPFGVEPRTEILGDDQFLRVLLIWGFGPLEVTDIKIGETPIEEFEDVEIEQRDGFATDGPLTLITRDVHEEPVNLTLTEAEDPVRVTQPETDEIAVDVTAPDGIFLIKKKTGAYRAHSVTIEFSYRPVAGGAWTLFDTMLFRRLTETVRRAGRAKVARGQYEVKARLIVAGADADEYIKNETVIWSVLRSTTNVHPIKFPEKLCMTALRIRASDQLSGVVSNISGTVKSLVKAYDGAAWNGNTYSSNPADLFRHVLQGPAQARPKTDSEIDLETIQDWWTYCDIQGFTYNKVCDGFRGTWELLCEIASAGRGFPMHRDGRWSVAWDRPTDIIRQHFTPKNAWAFSSSKTFAEPTHAWRIPFIDAARDYAESERTVYADGYNAANATKFEQIELPGVTNKNLVWRHGRFHIAQIELRPQTTSFSVDWESVICQRGDRVRIASDIDLIGQISGYVKGTGTAGGFEYIDIDEIAVMEAGKEYSVGFTRNNGQYLLRSVHVPGGGGQTTRLNLAGFDSLPQDGNLYSFGESLRETATMRVKEIAFEENLRARITVVDDAPEISDADNGEIPDYDPGISLPANPLAVRPTDLRVIEWLESAGKALRIMVRLSWQMPRAAFIARFETQKRDDDAGEDWQRAAPPVNAPRTSVEFPVDSDGTWSFRVRAIFVDKTASNWANRTVTLDNPETPSGWAVIESVELFGNQAPPPDIKNLHRTYVAGNSTLDWDEVQDARDVRYEVRRGVSHIVGMTVADRLAQPRFATVGNGTYWIAAFVLTPGGERIYSAAWTSAVLADSVLTKNIIVEYDEQALGWPGDKDGCTVSSGVLTADGTAISDAWALEMLADINLTEGERVFAYRAPAGHLVDVQRIESCPLNVIWEGVGAPLGEDFLAVTDVLAMEDVLNQAAARFVRVYPVMRVARVSTAAWEPWQPFSPGSMKGRYFQAGLVGYSLDPEINPACPVFRWAVDVPDRVDNYNALTVPAGATGLAIVFRPDATPATPSPFNGGPAGQALPNVGGAILNAGTGLRIEFTSLTLSGVTVKVLNDVSGVSVGHGSVNIQAVGY